MDAEFRDDEKDGLASEWGGESRKTVDANEMNLEIDSKDERMHI